MIANSVVNRLKSSFVFLVLLVFLSGCDLGQGDIKSDPNGIILDASGSMNANLPEGIEQKRRVAAFCKSKKLT